MRCLDVLTVPNYHEQKFYYFRICKANHFLFVNYWELATTKIYSCLIFRVFVFQLIQKLGTKGFRYCLFTRILCPEGIYLPSLISILEPFFYLFLPKEGKECQLNLNHFLKFFGIVLQQNSFSSISIYF